MAKTASLYIRIDPDIKQDVETIYAKYGMSITDAINVFLYQSRNVGGLPFDLREAKPNANTLAAFKESEKIIASREARFDSADALLEELKR